MLYLRPFSKIYRGLKKIHEPQNFHKMMQAGHSMWGIFKLISPHTLAQKYTNEGETDAKKGTNVRCMNHPFFMPPQEYLICSLRKCKRMQTAKIIKKQYVWFLNLTSRLQLLHSDTSWSWYFKFHLLYANMDLIVFSTWYLPWRIRYFYFEHKMLLLGQARRW